MHTRVSSNQQAVGYRPITMQKTFNKDLYLEVFNAFISAPGIDYTQLDLGFCAFTVGVYEVVCIDLTVPSGHSINNHLISISCDAVDTLIEDAFGSVTDMMRVLDKIQASNTKLLSILKSANDAYQKTMKLKFESWRDTTDTLQDFLELSDFEYLNYLKNEH